MAWIELHQSLPSHRKLKRLVRELGLKKNGVAQAVGHLSMLWLWSIDNAPSGDFSEIDPIDISDAAGWDGDPLKFLAALETSGFVDDRHIHDWYAYIGKLVDRRDANARRNRDARARNKNITSASRAHHDTHTSASRDVATVPNRTQPYLEDEEDTRAQAREESATDWTSAQVIDYEWLRVADCYMTNIGSLPEGRAQETLLTFYEDLGADVLIAGIEHTNESQPASPYPFLKALLNNWAESGVRTAEQAHAAILDHKRKIGAAKPERNGNHSPPQAPVPRAMVDILAEQAKRGDKPRDPPKLPAGAPGGSP